ncbi:MAG: tetratricopeptide repeat protein [Brevinematales bacterium]|nr:tetratricopeptide repeat protein [Brevinematales bacterium]
MRNIFFVFAFLIFACGTKDTSVKTQVKTNIEEFKKTGYSFYRKGNLSNAIDYFKKGIELAYSVDSTYQLVDLYCALGDIYLSIGDLENASNNIFMAERIEKYERSKNSFIVLLSIAKYYVKLFDKTKNEKFIEKAENYFELAQKNIQTDEDWATYYNNYGKLLIKINNFSQALQNFEKAIKINEAKKNYLGVADNFYNIGILYEKQGEYEKALFNYKKALQNDKLVENSDGIYLDNKKIGQIYAKIGNKEMSKYYLEKAKLVAISLNNKDYLDEIEKLLKE